ncbi:MAG: hypothetical protein N2C14_06230, partial [Planctomycetales bacterium]
MDDVIRQIQSQSILAIGHDPFVVCRNIFSTAGDITSIFCHVDDESLICVYRDFLSDAETRTITNQLEQFHRIAIAESYGCCEKLLWIQSESENSFRLFHGTGKPTKTITTNGAVMYFDNYSLRLCAASDGIIFRQANNSSLIPVSDIDCVRARVTWFGLM